MPLIKLKTLILADIETCFNLSRDLDLHQLSTAQTNEKAIGGKTTGLIGLHEEVEWRAKHFGIYMKLRTRITAFDFPNTFTDEMVKGPLRKMKHRHIFVQKQDTTQVTDLFYFESPFGIAGRLVNYFFLRAYMEKLLITRNNFIKQQAEKQQC